MIKPGEWYTPKLWKRFCVRKVAELPSPSVFPTRKWGQTGFRPIMAEVERENGTKALWFPYYIGPVGREKYVEYAPVLSGEEFLALLQEAIGQDFFSERFLGELESAIAKVRETRWPSIPRDATEKDDGN